MRIKLMRDSAFAPCCYIIVRERADGTFDARDEASTLLIQTDWDYPSVARSFGWGMTSEACDHSATDGTINCPECGLTAEDFITAASHWLAENVGAVAEDPGYF
jgi:hypothetical protein